MSSRMKFRFLEYNWPLIGQNSSFDKLKDGSIEGKILLKNGYNNSDVGDIADLLTKSWLDFTNVGDKV